MSAKNIYHDTVVRALREDGWTITHDPLRISFGGKDLYVDLGAEKSAIAAEKEGRKIAVEIQSFVKPSPVRDLEEAIGQFEIYRTLLSDSHPQRTLYMAVPRRIHESFLTERFGQFIITKLEIPLMVFDESTERIIQWTS